MNKKMKNTGVLVHTGADRNEISADDWNKGIKCITLLYHWGMIEGYEDALRIMGLYQNWIMQGAFKHDEALLPQLQGHLPPIMGPKIWACFHVGPYALLARALLQRGEGLVVLLKESVYKEQYPIYVEHFKRMFGRAPEPTELYFVCAEEMGALIKLRHCIERGLHVLCYVDGQEGAIADRGWTSVNVHHIPLDVRQGMAVLSQWTKTPICPLLMTVDEDRLQVRYRPEIAVTCKDDYGPALQYAYQLLETLRPEEFIQWEFSHHLFANMESVPVPDRDDLLVPVDIQGKIRIFNMGSRQILACREEAQSAVEDLRVHISKIF